MKVALEWFLHPPAMPRIAIGKQGDWLWVKK